MKERFLLDRVQMNSAGVSIYKAEKLSVAVLPHPAKASFAARNAAFPGTELAANIAPGQWFIKGRKAGLHETLLRGLGKSFLVTSKSR